jgi:putative ATPase
MPEARIPLAEAALYVATAPKSNAAYMAVDAALREAKNGPSREVPNHLKDASLDSQSRGHGKGYQYPHNFPSHYVSQEYLPQPIRFYEPTEEGAEAAIAKRLASLKSKKSS